MSEGTWRRIFSPEYPTERREAGPRYGPISCVRLGILAERKTLKDYCYLLFNSHLWRDADQHEWSHPEPGVPRLVPQQLGLHLENIAAHWLR